MGNLFQELKRRKVFRVAAVYTVVAWLLIEVSATILPALQLPDWTVSFVTILFILGLPMAIILAWAYEITPEGIKRDSYPASDEPSSEARQDQTQPASEVNLPADEKHDSKHAIDENPSIAVLPFTNLSQDEENEFLADGMTDEIITLLSADPNLIIMERNSSFSYKGKYHEARNVAHELQVRYLVEGSIRAVGENVRVNVQLVEGNTGTQIWGMRFDRPISKIFDVQDDVVDSIAKSLGGEVYRAEGERSRQRLPESLNEWGLVVRATTELGKLGTSGFEEVVSLCRRAIEVNPETALAYALLANALAMQSTFSPKDTDTTEPLKHAEHAMSLANDDPLVLTYAAGALSWLGLPERAITIAKRSIELAPNIVTSYGILGFAYLVAHKPEEAIKYINQAIKRSPRDLSLGRWYTSISTAYGHCGDWQAAYDTASTATERMPEFAAAWVNKAWAQLNMGQYENAVNSARTATELAPKYWIAWLYLAEALQMFGDFESTVDAAQMSIDLKPDHWRALVILANALGQLEKPTESKQFWDSAKSLNPKLSLNYIESKGGVIDGLLQAKIK